MICIIDCGTSWLEEIKKNLAELNQTYQVIKINELGKVSFNYFSGIIISGASTLLTKIDLQKYLIPFQFVKRVNIPILGICLGHQIIGLLYGSAINAGKMINKKERIEIIEPDDLFLEIKNNSLFQEEHSEFITLPRGFYLLAKSATCDNEAMKHKDKKLYGVQFHPEKSNENGKKIFKNFLKICP